MSVKGNQPGHTAVGWVEGRKSLPFSLSVGFLPRARAALYWRSGRLAPACGLKPFGSERPGWEADDVRVLFHCHLWPEGMKEKGDPAPGSAAHLSAFARETGFDLAVGFAPFDSSKTHATSRALPGQEPNRWLAEQIQPFRNLTGFATIDLNALDAREQLLQALKLGLRGIKVHPSICRLDIADRRHDPFY